VSAELEKVRDAILDELGGASQISAGILDEQTTRLAEELESWHQPGANPRSGRRA
jgi:hypothetical protein